MKKFLRNLLKLFMLVSYPILLIALVVAITLFFIRSRELSNLNNTFSQAQDQLNQENQNKQVTIADLRSEFETLTKQVSDLRTENASLKDSLQKMQVNGYATISGKILPFVSGGVADFSQYQMVCAESTTNSSVQVCRTVSALEQAFTLGVPAGTYHISAQIFPTPKSDSPLAGFKAYYTAYIKCVRLQPADKCADQAKTPVDLTLKAGDSLSNIDPIDWQKK